MRPIIEYNGKLYAIKTSKTLVYANAIKLLRITFEQPEIIRWAETVKAGDVFTTCFDDLAYECIGDAGPTPGRHPVCKLPSMSV